MLSLNPKFDIETGLAKLRDEMHRIQNTKRDFDIQFESSEGKMMKLDSNDHKNDEIEDAKLRQIFDPREKWFNYANRRLTDLQENGKV